MRVFKDVEELKQHIEANLRGRAKSAEPAFHEEELANDVEKV